MLAAGRVLMGIGCAGVFTGAFYVMALWVPSDRVVTQIGTLNGFASFGTLCATAPFAALIAWIGWRDSYWLFTLGVGLLTVAVAVVMRDAPPGRPQSTAKGESLRQIFGGVREAIRQPGVKRLLVAGLPMSAGTTIAGAWGAPYLKHVHGVEDLSRGKILLLMAVASMCGHVIFGQLARRLNTIKWLIIGGGGMGVLTSTMLAAMTMPPVAIVTGLFALIGITSAYPTVIHAHARGLVPAHLIGRGVSVTNMGIMVAIASVQLGFGWIVELFPIADGASPEHAYRVAFAAQAAVALIGLLIYAPVPDVKPRG
jgi:predicted MFS family arabinose efflux permease